MGVLVAVSIPIFTSQLEKSREATDLANIRAAYAEAIADLLTEESKPADATTTTVYYDAGSGKLVSTKPANTYLKGTTQTTALADTVIGNYTYTTGTDASGKVVKAVINYADGTVTLSIE